MQSKPRNFHSQLHELCFRYSYWKTLNFISFMDLTRKF